MVSASCVAREAFDGHNGERGCELEKARWPVRKLTRPLRVLPKPNPRMVGRANTLQAPASSFAGIHRVGLRLALSPFGQRPFARDSKHRRSIEPVAENLERG